MNATRAWKPKIRPKRVRDPEEEEVAGIIASYDSDTGLGTIDIGGESIPFERTMLTSHGFSRIMEGAQVRCGVVPNNGDRKVVTIFEYRLPKQQPQLPR